MKVTRTSLSIAIAAIGFGLQSVAAAQTAPATGQKVEKIEKIEVTGSNIKRVDTEGSTPIQVISREEITRSGKSTITELLSSLPTNAGGGLNDLTGSNSFSSGASSLSLRGLGSASTLVLLNGRRIAPFAPADPNFGQSAVVNLDALPLDVVERVEILKDGASAIYGSEAVAGVVNIILRKDFTGAQAGGAFSINRDSEYRNTRVTATLGVGELGRDRYNFFVNFERFDRERVGALDVQNYFLYPVLRDSAYATYRRFASSYAGNYLIGDYDPVTLGDAFALGFVPSNLQPANCNPGAIKDAAGRCRWDNVERFDVIPKSQRNNIYARGNFDINANLSAFAEFGFNKTDTTYRGNPQLYGDFGSWYSSDLQRLVNIPEVLPANHPNNPFGEPIIYRHRFVEVGNADRKVVAKATRALVGVKGSAANWDWEAGYLFTKNDNKATVFNQIRASVLTRGILNGSYNFFNPTAGAVKPDDLRVNTVDEATSSFQILDLKASTELVQMPAGPLGLAVGFEHRREDREARPDRLKLAGEVVGFGAAFAEGDRNVNSLYAELAVPIVKSLEAQVAFRADKYSDYGRSTTPKIGAKWKVVPAFALRGSYAQGFRAPSLTEISKSSVTAFTTVTDPKRCITGDEPDCGRGVALLLQSNNALQPEKSKSYLLGGVWEPIKDASISVDYFDIRRRNEVNSLDLDLILANEDTAGTIYSNRVIRTRLSSGQPGPIQAISTPFINGGKTEIKGFDIDGRYSYNLGSAGKISTRAQFSFYKSWKSSITNDTPLIEYVTYGFPRTRGNLSAAWERGVWTVGMVGNYSQGYKVSRTPELTCARAVNNSTISNANLCTVSSNGTADFSLQYRGVKNLELNFVARNIFDKRPPLDALARPLNFTYHPFQSVYYTMSGNYKFW